MVLLQTLADRPARGPAKSFGREGTLFLPESPEISHSAEAYIAIISHTVGAAENELIYATPLAAEQDV